MPRPFIPLTIEQFCQALQKFPFTRQIDSVHMHHTFRPNHAQYDGLASIESMCRFHTEERGFADIAQHVTIAPDGAIVTGRSWNAPPASATGHNGSASFGPFMFEVIGDFDRGRDELTGPQREAVLQVIVAVQRHFDLAPESLRFHREMSEKSCPGTALDRFQIVEEVRQRHAVDRATPAAGGDGPFSVAFKDDGLTVEGRASVEAALETLVRPVTTVESPDAAELPESGEVKTALVGKVREAGAPRELTIEETVSLRPHVINLHEGMLTDGGGYSTLPEDVERLFGEDMERAFAVPEAHGMPPRAPGDPFRVMLWAHGGLINERQGLAIASQHREFWMRNGIYPVYFVWETGLLQTIGQLLRGMVPGIGARNIFPDAISDPALERAVRAAGGETVWSGMKRNAERAVLPSGGGRKAMQELKRFCDRHAGAIELHAAGHSAGAIFLSHVLPAAFDADLPPLSGLYLLAPAISVAGFKERLLGLIGKKIRRATLLTMVKERERDDHCARIYRKSLLYLIRFALEHDREAEILGLEESLRRDRDLTRLFGLAAHPPAEGEVVFSPSPTPDGRSASRSTTHGGFDDDGPSMNSIARRVLNLQDAAALPMRYPEGSRVLDEDSWTVPEVADLQRSFATAVVPTAAPIPTAAPGLPGAPAPAGVAVQTGAAASSVTVLAPSQGNRRALCVGIDRYPVRPLAGCVADARLWARTLQGLGFECELLLEGDATYDGIKSALARLIASARPGDVVVWQYAGHGTQVPDVNGDEQGGDSAGVDEAICPIDLQSGRLFVDDEIATMTANLAAGVNFTMFIDCCHSGTISRFGFGPPPAGSVVRDERARFLPLSDELRQAYQAFAQKQSRTLTRTATRGTGARASEALFSACLSTELAWESDGHGEFTLRATSLLRERGLSFTNQAFIDAVVSAFGAKPRQTPNITSVSELRGAGLLQPVGATGTRNEARTAATASAVRDRYAALAGAFDDVARSLRAL